MKFHWSFISAGHDIFDFFTTRSKTTHSEFGHTSKILKMRKFLPVDNYYPISYYYSISQELFLMRFEDKFQAMKRFFQSPLSIFSSDDLEEMTSSYLSRILKEFKESTGKVTMNLPLRKRLFDQEIDDALFESYLSKTVEANQREPISSNYRREYAVNFLRKDFQSHATLNDIGDETRPDLVFSLIHFKKVIVATNEDENYAKFILNLLNVLSTWYSLKLLNVPLYVRYLRKALRSFRSALCTFSRTLYKFSCEFGSALRRFCSSLCRFGGKLLRRRTNRVQSAGSSSVTPKSIEAHQNSSKLTKAHQNSPKLNKDKAIKN